MHAARSALSGGLYFPSPPPQNGDQARRASTSAPQVAVDEAKGSGAEPLVAVAPVGEPPVLHLARSGRLVALTEDAASHHGTLIVLPVHPAVEAVGKEATPPGVDQEWHLRRRDFARLPSCYMALGKIRLTGGWATPRSGLSGSRWGGLRGRKRGLCTKLSVESRRGRWTVVPGVRVSVVPFISARFKWALSKCLPL